jgi:HD superfamily phosphohydrolase
VNPVDALPEMAAFRSPKQLIRIPAQTDVPVTPRVLRLIDTRPFQRLRHITQLGLVGMVYPGAQHSRWEHSLGVYRNALLFLSRLQADPGFVDRTDQQSLSCLLVASLMHDIAHWPFCHAIEDMRLPEVEKHENLARQILHENDVAECLREDWGLEPDWVADLLSESPRETQGCLSLLRSILSGPIDIDKLDYLERDSLHAGVPYGRNFDSPRLISSLCVGAHGESLAVDEKGRTAAEMMVFARYVMFSEVYWHHAVRSATAMLQRAFYLLPHRQEAVAEFQAQTDGPMIQNWLQRCQGSPVEPLLRNLFGGKRRLYKRLAEFHVHDQSELHAQLARRPYETLLEVGRALAQRLADYIHVPLGANDVLIDAPPAKLEVQFKIDVRSAQGEYRPLSQLSPVVRALAEKQFDDIVKRVRIFIASEFRSQVQSAPIPSLLRAALRDLGIAT